MSRRQSLTQEEASAIKLALWNGHQQAKIAASAGVGIVLINHIARGYIYTDAPWPDGSTGGSLSEKKRQAIELGDSLMKPFVRTSLNETQRQIDQPPDGYRKTTNEERAVLGVEVVFVELGFDLAKYEAESRKLSPEELAEFEQREARKLSEAELNERRALGLPVPEDKPPKRRRRSSKTPKI